MVWFKNNGCLGIQIRLVIDSARLKFWMKAGLFAEFVGGDSIELPVPFDRNYFLAICVNGMLTTLSEQIESVFFKIAY